MSTPVTINNIVSSIVKFNKLKSCILINWYSLFSKCKEINFIDIDEERFNALFNQNIKTVSDIDTLNLLLIDILYEIENTVESESESESESETDWEADEELKKTLIPHHTILRKYIKNLPKGYNTQFLPCTASSDKFTESIILPADSNEYNQDITYYYNPAIFKVVENSKTHILEYIKKE